MKNTSLLIFGILALIVFDIALFMRLPHMSHSLWMDEGYTFLYISHILETGNWTMPSGVEYLPGAWVYTFLQVFFSSFLGLNEFGLRFLSLLSGVCVPLFSMFLARFYLRLSFFSVFLIGLLLAVSSWSIAWSTQARWYQLLQLFYILSSIPFFLLFSAYQKKNYFLFAISIFVIFFCYFLLLGISPFAHILPIIFFVFLLCLFLQEKLLFVISLLSLALFILSFFAPFFHFDYFLYFLFQHTGITLFFFIALFFTFFSSLLSPQKVLLLLFPLLPFVALVFFVEPEAYRYLFPLYPFLYLFIFFVFDKYIWVIFFLPLLFFQEWNTSFQSRIFLESDIPKNHEYIQYTPQPNFKAAFEYVSHSLSSGEVLYTSYPELAKFYNLIPDAVLPFDWYDQKDLHLLQFSKTQYTSYFHFYDIESFIQFTQHNTGYIVVDDFAFQKFPTDLQYYIQKFPLVFEHQENIYSRVFVFRFFSKK